MKKPLLLIAVLIMILTMIPFPIEGRDGSFNMISRLTFCRTSIACLHEIGHALDQKAGWVSQSPGFSKALQMYLFVELRKNTLSILPVGIIEITYRGRRKSGSIKMELYAYLFQWSEGKPDRMPESLRPFFDWELAARFISMLTDDRKIYWMN